MNTEQLINADRDQRGLTTPAGPRRTLINLAIEAGYNFTQIAEQLRSGRDEPSGLRCSPTDTGEPSTPGGETLLDRAMRDA